MAPSSDFFVTIRCRLKTEDEVSEPAGALAAPHFRVHLPWDNARMCTPKIVSDEGGWEELSDARTDVPEPEGGEDAEAAEDADAGPKGPLHVRWKDSFKSLATDTAALARLNQMPYAFIVLGDDAGGALSTAVTAADDEEAGEGGAAAAAEGEDDEGAAAPGARNFIGAVHVDLSPLLLGSTCVTAHFVCTGSPFSREGAAGSPQSYHAPHEGLWEMDVAIGTASGKALVNDGELYRNNPMAFNLRGAADLPGLRVEAERLKEYTVGPGVDAFTQQRRLCKPMYVVCRLPEEFSSSSGGGARLVVSNGVVAAPGARWEHVAAFNTGHLDRHRLEQWLASGALRVELHDRDPTPSVSDASAGAARFEAALAGADMRPPPGNKNLQLEQDLQKRSAADREALEAAGAPAAGGENAGPRLLLVDEVLYLPQIVADWAAAGDDHAHGYVDVRLTALLDQSAQLIEAFARNRSGEAAAPAAPAAPRRGTRPRGRGRTVARRPRRSRCAASARSWPM
uniref:Uncharacterized protein n=1 Tax=Phaeomonas parva TaxID=124430 RepID=A0A7S1XWH8_9STRA